MPGPRRRFVRGQDDLQAFAEAPSPCKVTSGSVAFWSICDFQLANWNAGLFVLMPYVDARPQCPTLKDIQSYFFSQST